MAPGASIVVKDVVFWGISPGSGCISNELAMLPIPPRGEKTLARFVAGQAQTRVFPDIHIHLRNAEAALRLSAS
jgi:hypothetical protein